MTDLPNGVRIYPSSSGVNLNLDDLVANFPRNVRELFEAVFEASLPDNDAYVFGFSSDGSLTIDPVDDEVKDPVGYAQVQLTAASLASNLADTFGEALRNGTFLVEQPTE